MTTDLDTQPTDDGGGADVRNHIERLEHENARLRARLDSRLTYRRVAALFVLAAAVTLGATRLLPAQSDVLVALTGTGVFGALLLLVLMAEPMVRTPVASAVSDVRSRNLTAVREAIEVDGPVLYLPVDGHGVRLYVSAAGRDRDPPPDVHELTVVDVANYRGLSLSPVGGPLVDELHEQVGDLPADTADLLPILTEAVEDLFELATDVEAVSVGESLAAYDTQITIQADGVAFGVAADLDHPVQSVLGVGLARALDRPVGASATTTDDGKTLITFGWDEKAGPAARDAEDA